MLGHHIAGQVPYRSVFDEIESTRFPNITNHYQKFDDQIITLVSNYCFLKMISADIL